MKKKPIIKKIAIFLFWLGCLSVFKVSAQISPTCFAPGSVVVSDATSVLILPQLDIENVYAAEPVFSDGSEKVVFTVEVQHLYPLPAGSWNVFFTSGGTTHFVQMSTLLGNPEFRYGTVSSLLGIPTFNYQGTLLGNYDSSGKISFYVDKNLLGNPSPGHIYAVSSRVYINTVGIGLVEVDNTSQSNYSLAGNGNCSQTMIAQWGQSGDIPVQNNYNRNETDDFAVWRPEGGVWFYLDPMVNETSVLQWGSGTHGDIPVSGNYDYDGKADYTVYRPQEGNWYIFKTETNSFAVINFGIEEDIPLAGDYDGDRVDDIAVFRPSSGVWYILNSLDSSVKAMQFGLSEDRPVSGDFDGDRRADIAIFRPSAGAWYIWQSASESLRALSFGLGTDIQIPADYDGDQKTDVAVWRPETGAWIVLNSNSNEITGFQWGQSNDIPVPGDYNGNGRADYAVFRPFVGVWYSFHN